jgi:hypothetical protein
MLFPWFKSLTLKEEEAGLPKLASKSKALHDITPQNGTLLIQLLQQHINLTTVNNTV